MASEYVTTDRFVALDRKFGHIVEQTRLKGALYRRALVLLEVAGWYGGANTESFRAWLSNAPENWLTTDPTIIRALSQVPADPDANS